MVSLYDKECLTIPTAVKAIWMLYRRGRWDLLKRVGLKQGEAEPVFLEFEDAGTFGVGGSLKSQRQVRALIHAYPPIVDTATRLVGVYMIALGDEIPEVERMQAIENISCAGRERQSVYEQRPSGGEPAW